MPPDRFSYNNASAVLATMHGKERVIAPLLERNLGLRVELALGWAADNVGRLRADCSACYPRPPSTDMG